MMPEILASFSRAAGRSVYLLKSNRTSDIFTIKPRAVSRVSRIRLNCRSNCWRSCCCASSACARRRSASCAFCSACCACKRACSACCCCSCADSRACSALSRSASSCACAASAAAFPTRPCRFLGRLSGLGIRYRFLPRGFLRGSARSSFPIGRLLLLARDALVLLPLQRQQPGCLGVLHRLARRHDHRPRTRLARLVSLRLPQQVIGAVIGILRVLIRVGHLRDLNRVLGFQQLQRHILIGLHLVESAGRAGHGIRAALQQIVFHAGLLDLAERVLTHHVLHHHHVARLADAKIRLGGHDEGESLQIRSHVQVRTAAVQNHFAQIFRAPLGRDGPQNIG